MKASIHHPHLNHAERRHGLFFFFFFQDLVTLVNKTSAVVAINIGKNFFQNSDVFKLIFILSKASDTLQGSFQAWGENST